MHEDTISGTLVRCTMCSLLTFSKDYASKLVLPIRKWHFFKNRRESISRQNCIFGGFSPGKKPAILSSQKASALFVLMHLERDGWRTTIRLQKKCVGMRQSRIPTHPDILVIVLEVIQSKEIPMRNYKSAARGIKLFTVYFWLINRRAIIYIKHPNTRGNWVKAP